MGSKLKVGVIGIGSLGKEHARVYSELEAEGRVEFAGVYDVSAEALRGVSEKLGGVNVFTSQEELVERCDAVSIVTPTVTHFELAKTLLLAGKHVLVEKPMC